MTLQIAFTINNKKSFEKSYQFLKYARTYLRQGGYAPALSAVTVAISSTTSELQEGLKRSAAVVPFVNGRYHF